jgi:hypothetical protein
MHQDSTDNKLLKIFADSIINTEALDDSLSNGNSGKLLFTMYYGTYTENKKYIKKAKGIVDEILNNFISTPKLNGIGLYSGLLGAMCVLRNLRKNGLIKMNNTFLIQIDEIISSWAINESKLGNFEFFTGVSGALNYFINNLSDTNITDSEKQIYEDVIKIILREFLSKLIYVNEKYYLENENYNDIEKIEPGTVNFGLAHGMSSMIINWLKYPQNRFLAENEVIIKNYIDNIIELSKNIGSRTAYFVNSQNWKSGSCTYQKRLGWCHSDLNILSILALYDSGINTKYDHVLNKSLQFNIDRNTYEKNLLDDPYLCHGFSGTAMYFKYLNRFLRNKSTQEAFNFYIDKTTNYYINDDLKYNYELFDSERNNSFFYGNVGVGLTLLAALDEKYSSWSEIILL